MSIQLLPPETLSNIFEHALDPVTFPILDSDIEQRRKLLSSICLVSTAWRHNAYFTRTLWTLVDLEYHYFQEYELGPDFSAQWERIDRAGTLPLDIVLADEEPVRGSVTARPAFWEFWKMLKKKNTQWRSLSVRGVPLRTEDDVHKLMPTSLPNLAAAGVQAPAGLGWYPVASAPLLHHYDFRPNNFFPFSSANTLQRIDASGLLQKVAPVLERCHLLRELHIENVVVGAEWPHGWLGLPSLRQLVFKRSYTQYVENFLTILWAPNLQVISLEFPAFPTQPPVFDYSSAPAASLFNFPSLTTVEYSHVGFEKLWHLPPFLSKFANTAAITCRLEAPNSLLVPREEEDRDMFVEADRAMIWMEKNMKEVAWSDVDEVPPACFPTWQEARAWFSDPSIGS